MSLRPMLSGTGVALVTPFDSFGKIDYAALEKLINEVIDQKVEYIVTLGTTGETPTLSKQEKSDIIKFTNKTVQNRVPIVVGVGGFSTDTVIDELQSLPLDNATAILSASPYYNKPSQEGIYQHYIAIAENSPKPILLYNVPGRTGRNMTAATTLRLAEHPNIMGIKEASDDMMQALEILKNRPDDFLVVSGDDGLCLPQILCGMDGVITVAGNAFPRQFSDMVRAALNGNAQEAIQLNNPLLEAYQLMFEENNPAGIKAFLFEQGIIQNFVRLPIVPLSKPVHQKIKTYLEVALSS